MEWFYRGYKALHGWDQFWSVIIIFIVFALYRLGVFSRIFSVLGRILSKIDHAVDHSVNRPDEKESADKNIIDYSELDARAPIVREKVKQVKEELEKQKNRNNTNL